MDPHKQKQMVSQLFESSSKSVEELDKMTPEERKEYLRGRLKQRMFFNGVSRQSSQQKKKMQEKMEESTKDLFFFSDLVQWLTNKFKNIYHN